jgi:thiamine biosynthesis lipoprotein
MSNLTRRRFISICAAAGVAPLAARAAVPVARWTGTALGAQASATLAGITQEQADPLFRKIEMELDRIDDVFSLYRPASVLNRLNQEGSVSQPPAGLLEVLSVSDALNRQTGGAFDPTVQPLWTLYAEAALREEVPDQGAIVATLVRTGWDGVRFDSGGVWLQRPGMALTLNGIAQGYASDRIAGLLRAAGLRGVLVDMGEIVGVGSHPDGTPWRAGIADPDGGIFSGHVSLSDRALATSAPGGTVLDPAGRVGHIFDPRTGQPGGQWRQVSVSAPSAALADGLSTAFCLMSRSQIRSAAASFAGIRVEKMVA